MEKKFEIQEIDIKIPLKKYKIVIGLLLSIITLSFIFIVKFTLKLTQINDNEELILSMIKEKENNNHNLLCQISKRQINLNLKLKNNSTYLIDTIISPDEFACLLSWIDAPLNQVTLCYKETIHGKISNYLTSNCLGGLGIFVIIKTAKGNRFGGYLPVIDLMFSTRPFLFSLDNLTIFKLKPQGESHSIPEGMIIQFGEDIRIALNCTNNTNSYSNFPHDYGSESNKLSDLIGNDDNHFKITEVEILSIQDIYS